MHSATHFVAFFLFALIHAPFTAGDCGNSPGPAYVLEHPAGYLNSDGVVEIPSPPSGVLSNNVPTSYGSLGGYEANRVCTWLITSVEDPGSQEDAILQVYVHFSALNLTNVNDYVAIYEGTDDSGTLLANITGPNQVIPESVHTTSNTTGGSVYIVFVSSGRGPAGSGFGLYWQGGSCISGIVRLTKDQGWFTDGSGDYADYATRLTCGWLITSTDPTAVVSVHVDGLIEEGYDFLSIIDGPTANGPLLARLTGDLDVSFKSTKNSLFVLFFVDKTVCWAGFRVTYTIIPGDYCSGTMVLNQNAGRFGDGSSVASYLPNIVCTWVINPTVDVNLISIYFSEFDLQDDVLAIYEGSNTEPSRNLTGSKIPPAIVYEGPEPLTLKLTSNSANQGDGFIIVYHAGSCGATAELAAPAGEISDGSGDNNDYSNNKVCTWAVNLDPKIYQRIKFRWVYFSIEFRFDTFNLYDGSSDRVPSLALYSGYNQTFPDGETSGASLLIRFQTDADTTASGWKLNYEGIPFPPAEYAVQYYSSGPAIAFISLLMATAVVIVILFLFFTLFSQTSIMRDTSVAYNLFLLAMLFFACFTLFPFIDKPTDGLCAWRPWVALIYVTIYSTLIVKIYLIWGHTLFQSKEEKGVVFNPSYAPQYILPAFGVVCLLVAIEALFLVLWMIIDYPTPTLHDTNNTNEFHYRCESDTHAAWLAVQYTYIGLLLFVGLVGSVRVYVVPVLWSESKLLALSVVLTVLITIAFIIILYVVWDIPAAWLSLMGFGIWLNIAVVLAVLYGPKVYVIVSSFFREEGSSIEAGWANKEGGGGAGAAEGGDDKGNSAEGNPDRKSGTFTVSEWDEL